MHAVPPYVYGARLTYGNRSKANLYVAGMNYQERCVKLVLGHWDAPDHLKEWKNGQSNGGFEICLGDKTLAEKLFDQKQWPIDVVVAVEEGAHGPASGGSRGRWVFVTDSEDQLCYEVSDNKDKEVEPRRLANFSIVKYLAIYQFSEYGESPMQKLLVRHRLDARRPDGSDEVVYVTAEDTDRSPPLGNATLLEVEVVIKESLLKTATEVKDAFMKSHSLLCTEGLTPDMLSSYLNEIGKPLPKSCIVRWGLQPDGWWVMANAAFKDGEICAVESSGHAYSPERFITDPHAPMPAEWFPRIVIIPFKHVRYQIGCNMWNSLMPAFFQNNELPAKCVLSLAVLGLHADKNWGGQAGHGHGMPIGWVYSPEMGTGKSEAAALGHAACSLFHHDIFSGDASKSVTFASAGLMSNMTMMVDDVVPAEGADGDKHSRYLAQLVRAFYDRTTRVVDKKVQRIFSSIIYSSNSIANPNDAPFQSRLVTIPFKALKGEPGQKENPRVQDQFSMAVELMSALTPDLQTIGLNNGKLDKPAIQDWAQFFHKACGAYRNRNLNEWAKVGWMWSLLNFTFQGDSESVEKMFEWLTVSVSRAVHELTNHAGLLDQFLIGIINVRETIAPNPLGPNPDKVLHHHNMRTTELPPLHVGNARFWAIRVGKVCHVLRVLTGKKFVPEQIHALVKESDWAFESRAKFYNTDKCPWPIKMAIVPEMDDNNTTLGFIDVPLPEDKLEQSMLLEQRCVFIKMDYIKMLKDSLDSIAPELDYKTIVVDSAAPGVGKYCFFKALTEDGWFGYDVLKQSTFRTFCGATNLMGVGSPSTDAMIVSDVEMEMRTCGFESVARHFHPATLLEYFTYKWPTHEAICSYPPCYTRNAFEFRNAQGDDPPENPIGGMLTEPPSAVGTPTKSRASSVAPSPRSRATGPMTGLSPNRRRERPEAGASPLGAHDGNTLDAEDAPPIKRRRRMRASPTNHARYPRPPEEVNSLGTAKQWTAYALARGLGRAGTSRFVVDEAEDEAGEEMEKVRIPESNPFTSYTLTLSYPCPHVPIQEGEEAATAEDDAFIDDNPDAAEANHSQGDADLEADLAALYAPGKCMAILGFDEDTNEDILCESACNPQEQLCHYCRTQGHRMTGMF